MANRYWIGGSNTWDLTNTAVWSASSGGSGGASVPTSSDNVFFDQAGTYSIATDAVSEVPCYNITVSVGTYTFSTTGSTIGIYGSVTLHSTTVWNKNLLMRGSDSRTLTTNGATLSSTTQLFCLTASVTLGSDITAATYTTHTSGTFDTAGYACSFGSFSPGGSSSATINWRNSAITIRNSGSVFVCTSTTFGPMLAEPTATLTFSASTAYSNFINIAGTSQSITIPKINGGSGSGTGTIRFLLNTNNVVYDVQATATGSRTLQFENSNTKFANFNFRGQSGNPYTLKSNTAGTARTITKPGTWYMGANSTNVSNNTNLTFTAGGGIDYLSVQDITGSALPTGNFLPLML